MAKIIPVRQRNGTRHKISLAHSLIVGLFCLVLVALFLVTALMEVRRTQNLLLDVFQNQAVTIIETVQMLAEDRVKGLLELTNQAAASFQDLENIERGFQMQEAIVNGLIAFGKEVDRKNERGRLSEQELKTLAAEAGVEAIFLYDAHKGVVSGSAPAPEDLTTRLKNLLKRGGEIILDFHGDKAGEEASYWVGVRRKDPEEMIFLVFGREEFQYWASRTAIQEAIEEGGWRKGVHYFMVVDSQGRLLAGAGDLTMGEAREKMSPVVEEKWSKDGRSARRILKGSPEILEVYAPLIVNGRRAGIARTGIAIEEVTHLRERNQIHIFFSTGLMTICAVLAMLLFYRLQARHHRKIQDMNERLLQGERLSSLGRLAAGVAHEIRNPLNAVSMAIQRIRREFKPAEPRSNQEFTHLVTVIRDEIGRLNGIIEDFVGPARLSRAEFRPERLADFLERVVRLVKEEAGSRGVHIECRCDDPGLTLYMDAARMHQALLNLIKNALESIPGHGTIAVTARSHGPRHAVISIRDTGVGIPPEVIERILDFEYTTKKKGLGLGLPIAKEIIRAHGGEIRIESKPGKGTLLELILPRKEI